MSNLFEDKTPMPPRPEGVVKVDQAPDEPFMSSRPIAGGFPGSRINSDMSVTNIARPRFGHGY